MISVLILSLLLATIQAASPFCGPSSPSGFMVVALDGAGSGKSNICNEFNMDPADVTTSTANEASDVIFSCLGYMRHALINSYYGQTYDETCLSGYVSSTSPGLSIGVSPDCSLANAVLCKQRLNQAVVTPTITTTAATVTTTITPTATATIPISYPTIPVSQSPCTTPDGKFTMFDDELMRGTGDEVCYNYGMYLADITDIMTEGLDSCMTELLTNEALIGTTVPGNFGLSYLRGSHPEFIEAVFSNRSVVTVDPSLVRVLCMRLIDNAGVFEYEYQAFPPPSGAMSFAAADAFCAAIGFLPAVYSLLEKPPIIGGIPPNSYVVTRLQMPVPSECAFLYRNVDLAGQPSLNVIFSYAFGCTEGTYSNVVCRQWNEI